MTSRRAAPPLALCARPEREEFERAALAPYACRAGDHAGRAYPEEEDPFRTAFQRDRDRVVHCAAFRRLEYKTQVFINSEGDHYRTRLTHSLEVSQIARSLAGMLRLNEDLVEAVALAHDLGHTPFGHAGERALNDLMRDHGGFEHNLQALRVVELLEQRTSRHPGLNLTAETREGIRKHAPAAGECSGPRWPHLEGQVVDIADELAYNNHDIDDGLFSRLLALEDVMAALPEWRDVYEEQRQRHPGHTPRILQRATVSAMISRQIQDVARESLARIERLAIQTPDDARRCPERVIDFSPAMQDYNKRVKEFLFASLYRHHLVMGEMNKCERMMGELFRLLTQRPQLLRPRFYERIGKPDSVYRVVSDYLAGMTDRYAIEEYQRLFIPELSFHARR